ncbi:hypothetical protein Tco_0717356 [Tanacetum coccineum]
MKGRKRVEDLQLGVESYQTKLNLEQPNWDASDFLFKEDYTIVNKPRAVIYRDSDDNKKIMRINEVHKFSDGTLMRIRDKLDFMVKDSRLFKFNKGMETRKWTGDDKRRSEDFIEIPPVLAGSLKMRKSENKGIVSTEMELVLEYTQQGSSHEVSVSTEGVEELKRSIRIKGVKKEALHTLRQKPVRRGPLPSENVVDLPLMDKLNENRILIRRYPETFLCIVGLSRSFVDTDIRPTLLGLDNNDMGLLDFVKSTHPFKVKVGERTLTKGEVPLLTKTAYMVVSLYAQIIHFVNHTIVDELKENTAKAGGIVISEPNPTIASKSSAAMKKLITQSGQPDAGSATHPAEDFVYSSVTPTPESNHQGESDSVQDELVRKRPASERFVVLTSSSEPLDTDVQIEAGIVSPKVISPFSHVQTEAKAMADDFVNDTGTSSIPENEAGVSSSAPGSESSVDDFFDSQTIDSATAQDIYVPNWNVTNDDGLDDPVMSRNLVDHQRDAEIVDLRSRLERAESEVAEVGILRRWVSGLEVEAAAKVEELAGLNVQELHNLGVFYEI